MEPEQTNKEKSEQPVQQPEPAPQAASSPQPQQTNYGGFGLRFVAYLIDGVVLFIFQMIVGIIFGIGMVGTMALDSYSGNLVGMGMNLIMQLVLLVGYVLYFSLMESSKNQGTLGKMALGLKVVDRQGQRISFGKALGRYFSKILSVITLGIGYLMIIWDEKKQGLHDKVVDTYVIKKN